MTVLTDQQVALVREIVQVRQDKNKLAKREKQLREQLLDVLTASGDTVGITASGEQVLELEEQPRTQVNRDRLQALHPEVFDDVVEDTSATFLRASAPFVQPNSQEDDDALSALADAAVAEAGATYATATGLGA